MLKSNRKIYMDYASATPVDFSVLSKMNKIFKQNYANASSMHDLGEKSAKILSASRSELAKALGAHSDEIILTSGATESNNLAILGVVEKFSKLPHIVTTNIEHPSVLEVCRHLEKVGRAEVTYVLVEKNGIVDSKKIKKAIRQNTVLVSVMYANNEIGTIQPIGEIAKEIRHHRKNNPKQKIYFHTDATQAVNYLPTNVEKLGVDLMSLNAGKIYGPKGIGLLYVKRNTELSAVLFGGGQEFGIRSGTENLAGIVGFSEALKITERIKAQETKRVHKLHDYFMRKLSNSLEDFKLNGDIKKRLPNNINITIPKIPSDLLVIELSARGIFVSEKSACKSGDKKGSHVLSAINNPLLCKKNNSIRFSMGRQTKKEDIDYVVRALVEILKKLEKWYTR